MRRVTQQHLVEVDEHGVRLKSSRGDCFPACIASLFEVPLDFFPPRDIGQELYTWLGQNYPGVTARTRYFGKRVHEVPYNQGFWVASVESPRFKDDCTACSPEREESDVEAGFWRRDECPWCDGTGFAPGWHAIVMENRELAWDPHPKADRGHSYTFVAETVFVVTDPARLLPRVLPRSLA